MNQYALKTRFNFTGIFFIHAKNKEEAKELVEENCGLVLGINIHSTLPDEVVDWDFPKHPEMIIGRVKLKNAFDVAL